MEPPRSGGAGDADDDDYMNMTFEDAAPTTESSVQRSQRLRREARARGHVKSKATLAREEATAREKALSTSLLDDPRAKRSKGLAMMAKMGFAAGGLGREAEPGGGGPGRTEPIRVSVRESRAGIGLDSERKRRLQEAAAAATGGRDPKAPRFDPYEYRGRASRENEEARLGRQLHLAQRVAEGLDEDAHAHAASPSPSPSSSRPLKAVPVVYRGLVRSREEKQRAARRRRELDRSLAQRPLGLDDDELAAFDALGVAERLRRVLEHLRREHRYCFWCKMAFPDGAMGDCPAWPRRTTTEARAPVVPVRVSVS